MKTHHLLVLAFLCCISFSTTGQIIDLEWDYGSTKFFEENLEKVKGSPWVYDEWTRAVIYNTEGEAMGSDLTKFHSGLNAFIVKVDDKLIELNKYAYNRVDLDVVDEDGNEATYIYRTGFGEDKHQYYRVIYESENVSYLEHTEARLREKTAAVYGVHEVSKQYIKNTKHFIYFNGELNPVKKNKKSILEALDDNKKLEKFLKKNGLKLKQDSEIIKALTYFDGLDSEK